MKKSFERDWFAVQLEAGETYEIRVGNVEGQSNNLTFYTPPAVYDANGLLIGASSGDYSVFSGGNVVNFTPDNKGTYFLSVSEERFGDVGYYSLSVSQYVDDFSDDTSTTGQVAVDGSVIGEIDRPGDEDWIAVTLQADQDYLVDLEGF